MTGGGDLVYFLVHLAGDDNIEVSEVNAEQRLN
jgi:hypothetical protein